MKRLAVGVGILVALVLLLGLSQLLASESGEIVVLTTTDAAGEPVQTRLWIVEYDGTVWLRSGQTGSGWFLRLEANPDVQVARGDATRAYRAEPTPGAREPINDLMREKYGWADWYIDALFDSSDAVPVRLTPR